MLKLLRRKENTMLVCGDVVCLHCSHLVGQLVARYPERLRVGVFRPGPGNTALQTVRVPFRCDRCGGSVYIQDVRPFSLATTLTPTEPFERKRRRGRSKSTEREIAPLAKAG